jgi:hypothetical protein
MGWIWRGLVLTGVAVCIGTALGLHWDCIIGHVASPCCHSNPQQPHPPSTGGDATPRHHPTAERAAGAGRGGLAGERLEPLAEADASGVRTLRATHSRRAAALPPQEPGEGDLSQHSLFSHPHLPPTAHNTNRRRRRRLAGLYAVPRWRVDHEGGGLGPAAQSVHGLLECVVVAAPAAGIGGRTRSMSETRACASWVGPRDCRACRRWVAACRRRLASVASACRRTVRQPWMARVLTVHAMALARTPPLNHRRVLPRDAGAWTRRCA